MVFILPLAHVIMREHPSTSSALFKFAINTKVARVVETEEQKEIQGTINRLVKWSAD